MRPGVQALGYAATRVAGTALAGVLLGALAGRPWIGMALALAAYLLWHLALLYRVEWWLQHRSVA